MLIQRQHLPALILLYRVDFAIYLLQAINQAQRCQMPGGDAQVSILGDLKGVYQRFDNKLLRLSASATQRLDRRYLSGSLAGSILSLPVCLPIRKELLGHLGRKLELP